MLQPRFLSAWSSTGGARRRTRGTSRRRHRSRRASPRPRERRADRAPLAVRDDGEREHERRRRTRPGTPGSCRATSGCRWRSSRSVLLLVLFSLGLVGVDRAGEPPAERLVNVCTNCSRTARQARIAVWHAKSAGAARLCISARTRSRSSCRDRADVGSLLRLRDRGRLSSAVTEIPEHLLKRSRERRSAIGLGGDDGGEAPADATPQPRRPRRRRPPATPRRRPPPAARRPPAGCRPPAASRRQARPAVRRRGQGTAEDPVLGDGHAQPHAVWAFMYVRARSPSPEVVAGPLGVGAEVYASCASCHGADGGGGVGRPFTDGEVLQTFPHIEDQLRFVYYGTESYNAAGVDDLRQPRPRRRPHVTGSSASCRAGRQCRRRAHRRRDRRRRLPRALHARRRRPDERRVRRRVRGLVLSGVADVRRPRGRRDVRRARTTSGLTDAEGEPFPIIDIGDAPLAGSAP